MTTTPAETRRNLRDLLDRRSARTGEITLATGAKSNFYFDCKPVTLSADGAYLVGMAFLDALEQLPERPQAVGGLTHGADPIVSSMVVLSHVRGCPIDGFYVRKEPKRHGTKNRIENPPEPGTKVVIVDDVVTSGGSLLQAVQEARAAGCEVIGVLGVCAVGDSPDDSWPSAHNLTHRVGATSPVSGRGRFSAAGETIGKIGSDAPRGSPAATIRTAARPLPASYLAFHIPIRG